MLAAPAYAQNLVGEQNVLQTEREVNPAVRRNISGFRNQDWRPHFSSLRNGAILVDIDSRALHY
jgi:hypothetical protein